MEIKLVKEEKIFKEKTESKIMTDSDINKKYIEGEIRVITETGRYPLCEVAKMFANKDKYTDSTDYQRGYVWNNAAKSRLIESFIMNIPIPPIFLYEKDYGTYEILDGKQRISSIVDFYNNEFRLEGLEVWSELNGKLFDELPEKIKSGIDRRYLSSIIMLKESSDKNAFDINRLRRMVFERLNTGGMILSPQESRNAIFGGKFNEMCKEMAKNHRFRKMLGFKEKKESLFDDLDKQKDDIHMRDSETVLRFFAFRQINEFDTNLSTYLDFYLNKANDFPDETISELKTIFLGTVDLAFELFGINAFRLVEEKHGMLMFKKGPVNTIYDPFMVVLAEFLERKEKLIKNKERLIEKYKEIIFNKSSDFNGKIQDKSSILKRMDIFYSLISEML